MQLDISSQSDNYDSTPIIPLNNPDELESVSPVRIILSITCSVLIAVSCVSVIWYYVENSSKTPTAASEQSVVLPTATTTSSASSIITPTSLQPPAPANK